MLTRFIDTEALLSRAIRGHDISLVTPATMSPTYEQGQVRDAMITHLPLFCCQQKALHEGVYPLSAVSGHKRYNTLHFASKVVCQQGCSAPLLDDPAKGGAAAFKGIVVAATAVTMRRQEWYYRHHFLSCDTRVDHCWCYLDAM